MPDILHMLSIAAAPEAVFAALSTREGVRCWWTRDAELDTSVGGIGEFRFYEGKTTTRVRIEALDPPNRVAWRVLSAQAPGGWEGTTITFDLRPDGEGTSLLFAHRGFAQESEGFARVSTGWAYYLVSLQQYLQTGEGAPHPDVEFGRMLS